MVQDPLRRYHPLSAFSLQAKVCQELGGACEVRNTRQEPKNYLAYFPEETKFAHGQPEPPGSLDSLRCMS